MSGYHHASSEKNLMSVVNALHVKLIDGIVMIGNFKSLVPIFKLVRRFLASSLTFH